MSNKIFYNEIKAEQQFLELINATVSHELRNPLSALMGQICSMEEFFKEFAKIISQLKENDLKRKLVKIYNGLHKCGTKMNSAAQFIDFFVHDILDYTILNKNCRNFLKD